MHAILTALVTSLLGMQLPASHPVALRAESAARDVVVAVEELPESERETWARLAFVFAFYESAWMTAAVGDGGRSLGVLQVNSMWLGSYSRADVLKDRVLGFRLGIRTMRRLVSECGSMSAGLGAYASGQCNGAAFLVKRRCKLAGVRCP